MNRMIEDLIRDLSKSKKNAIRDAFVIHFGFSIDNVRCLEVQRIVSLNGKREEYRYKNEIFLVCTFDGYNIGRTDNGDYTITFNYRYEKR